MLDVICYCYYILYYTIVRYYILLYILSDYKLVISTTLVVKERHMDLLSFVSSSDLVPRSLLRIARGTFFDSMSNFCQ